jgi:hypothetical protein
VSSERHLPSQQHESAMKAAPAPEQRRDAKADRPSRLDSASAIGNATLAHLIGREPDQAGERGQPLPAGLRAKLEQALGTSLGDVRIHTDNSARDAAASVDAEAFTRGGDIYLGQTAPTIGTPAAESLLAHEVMHVEQQRHAAAVEPRVSTAAEAAEGEAQRAGMHALAGQPAALSRGGSVAGVQRQPNQTGSGGLSITKTGEVDRAMAQRALEAFLNRVLSVSPRPDLRKSGVVKTALMTLAQKAGGSALFIDVDKFLANVTNDPYELARRFAQMLPATVNPDALEALNKLTTVDTPPGTGQRVGDLIKRTAPAEQDPTKLPPGQKDPGAEADRAVQLNQRLRGQPDPKTIGPGSIDVLRAARILGGLGGALKAPQQRTAPPEARTTGGIDAAVQKVSPDALVPAEKKGAADVEEFQVAQLFARDVATQIDIALQQGRDTVTLQLGFNFSAVKDKQALRAGVEAIIAAIREAFPDKASKVVNVDVRIGDQILTRGRVR